MQSDRKGCETTKKERGSLIKQTEGEAKIWEGVKTSHSEVEEPREGEN